jgi:hypothetical protein
LHNILKRKPQYYYTFEDGGCFVELLDKKEIENALSVKGITKCRDQNSENYLTCLSIS